MKSSKAIAVTSKNEYPQCEILPKVGTGYVTLEKQIINR